MQKIVFVCIVFILTTAPVAAQSPLVTPTAYAGSVGSGATSITSVLTCEHIQNWRYMFYAANSKGWFNLMVTLSIVSLSIGHIGIVLGTLTRKIYRLQTTGDRGRWTLSGRSYRRR